MPSPENQESAAAAFTRTGQDAVTYARRVAGTALARNERHRAANRELAKQQGRGRRAGASDPTPDALRAAARKFRMARGLPVTEPEPAPPTPERVTRATRSRDDEDDFSQSRIMRRDL